MASDVRIAVTLACTDCKRRNYQSNKSKRNDPERIECEVLPLVRQAHASPRDAVASMARSDALLQAQAEQASDAPAAPRAEPLAGRRRARPSAPAVQFIHECIAELRKVQWPTGGSSGRRRRGRLLLVIVIGVYIAALDSVLDRWSEWLIDQYATH